MKKYLVSMIVVGALVAVSLLVFKTRPAAAQTEESLVVYDSQGRLKVPDPAVFRKWVFVGAPLTPEGLNNGKYNCNAGGTNCTRANFPEYHHVYIERKNVDAYLKTGSFPEGTVIIKELTRVLKPTFNDGSRKEPSGRGFFNGEFNGIDMTIKDSQRFAKTNGWGFFTFGHHPLPYNESAAESPASECAICHQTFVSKTDMTWIQFYPILRDGNPTNSGLEPH